MKMKYSKFYMEIKQIIRYGVIGLLTTLINLICFHFTYKVVNITVATCIAGIISIAFAYFGNKIVVFKSKRNSLIPFFVSRILSLFIEMLLMNLLVIHIGINSDLSKIVSNIIVIILNYLIGKMWIFRRK